MSELDATPFPVKPFKLENGTEIPRSFIPTWLARIVWTRLVSMTGMKISLEQIAAAGGFAAPAMLDLLAGGDGNPPFPALRAVISGSSRSILGEVQIVAQGSKAHQEALREFESEQKEKERKAGRMVFGSAGVYGDGQAVKVDNKWRKP